MYTSGFHKVLVKFIPIISSGRHVRLALSKLYYKHARLMTCTIMVRICAARGLKYFDNILEFTFPAIGLNIVVMAVEGVACFILTLLLELNFFVHKFGLLCMGRDTNPAQVNPDDVSVQSIFYLRSTASFIRIQMWLRKRIELIREVKMMILFKSKILRKYLYCLHALCVNCVTQSYRGCLRVTKYAVRGLSLGIPRGECFGLLGING